MESLVIYIIQSYGDEEGRRAFESSLKMTNNLLGKTVSAESLDNAVNYFMRAIKEELHNDKN